jgi:hypothetical protein
MKLPQVSLRELFLLVALVAMGCGWWVERMQRKAGDLDRSVWQDRAFGLQATLRNQGINVTFENDGTMSANT